MVAHDEGLKESPVQYNHAGEWAYCATRFIQKDFSFAFITYSEHLNRPQTHPSNS